MKFTRGLWEWEDDVTPIVPSQVAEMTVTPASLTAYASQHPLLSRGHTLGNPLLTIHCTSPLPGVIRIQASHFHGQQETGPHFEVQDAQPAVRVQDGETYGELQSGPLAVRVMKDQPFRMEFQAEGRVLTASSPDALAYLRRADGTVYMRDQLSLAVGQCVYGLGERFGALVKNGQSIDIWNEDPGTGSDLTYKNIPFYLTNGGYGVFVNSPGRVSFEVATERVSRVQFSLPGEELDYYVIYGPTPREILEKYTALTGRPALPPAWSFGLWLTTSFTTTYDEGTVTNFIQGMADRDIPLHVFHFDCFWMKGFHWCDFLWDEAMFPDPAGFIARLHARGLKVCVWINPYIAQRSAMFAEGKAGGYLLRKPNGDVWQTDQWQAGMGIVDFTNPAAARWYADKLRALLAIGVDCFKTDFGERIPTAVVYHDGSDPVLMHNYYPYLYNKTVFELLVEARGKGEATVFARSATVGGQKFPVHWGGDCAATYESMAESLRGGLSLCASGFGFWSHDISGFEHTATPALYKRWSAFGLLSSHSRLHGSDSYRVPWNFDEEAVDVLRYFTKLKCRLMPYLFAVAGEAVRTGMPTMRAMVLEYPHDPACVYLDRQYLLGGSLLVAPVLNDHGPVEYYLPAGQWTDFVTGEVRPGGYWVREDAPDFFRIPLWVRENTVLPLGKVDNRPDYDYADGITLRCYQLTDGVETTVMVPDTTGSPAAEFRVMRTGGQIRVTRQHGDKPWTVEVVGHRTVAATADESAVVVPMVG